MNIKVRVKNFLKRFIILNEYCKKCGHSNNGDYFNADNILWEKVVNNKYNILCYKCFNKMANNKKIDIIIKQITE